MPFRGDINQVFACQNEKLVREQSSISPLFGRLGIAEPHGLHRFLLQRLFTLSGLYFCRKTASRANPAAIAASTEGQTLASEIKQPARLINAVTLPLRNYYGCCESLRVNGVKAWAGSQVCLMILKTLRSLSGNNDSSSTVNRIGLLCATESN